MLESERPDDEEVIGDVEPDATAYPHRDAAYMLTVEANWEEDDDANLEWACGRLIDRVRLSRPLTGQI